MDCVKLLSRGTRKYYPILLTAIVLFSIFSEVLYTCTAFSLVNDDTALLGKNLDWSVGDGFILLNRKGEQKKSVTRNGLPAEWTSRYNSITFNQPGKDLPLGGMNEAGLVVEELSYSPSRYTDIRDLPVVNELEWTQFQLDNYASVKEVKENLGNPAVCKYFLGLHYIVMDRTGQVMVVEFLQGNIVSYSGEELPYKVLSNNSYSNLLKYLQNFAGYGGEQQITNRAGSQERFVRVVAAIDTLSAYIPERAFNILESVKRSDTRWQIVYDARKLKIYFKLNGTKQRSLDLNKINFQRKERIAYFNGADSFAKTLEFEPFDQAIMLQFGKLYIDNLVAAGAIEVDKAERIKLELEDKGN